VNFGVSILDFGLGRTIRKAFFRIESRSENNLKSSGIVAFLVTLAMAGAVAQAQQQGKIFRIGFLDGGTASGSAVLVEAFRQELSKLGWIEGKNFTIEYRFAEGKPERQPELAADLVRLKIDLVVVVGTPAALAAKKATTAIPIVMASGGDPVGAGLVASLARPGGNVTGLSSLSPELNTKRLEILKDAVPKLARAGLLWLSGGGTGQDLQMKELRPAARALKIKLEEIETQFDAKGLESAFKIANRNRSTRLCRLPIAASSPKESGSSSLPSSIGCRPFTTKRSLSMKAVLCPMGRTSMTCIGARRFTSTKS
jgi:ABC-type uncharacterized transport system substrate-binding protein